MHYSFISDSTSPDRQGGRSSKTTGPSRPDLTNARPSEGWSLTNARPSEGWSLTSEGWSSIIDNEEKNINKEKYDALNKQEAFKKKFPNLNYESLKIIPYDTYVIYYEHPELEKEIVYCSDSCEWMITNKIKRTHTSDSDPNIIDILGAYNASQPLPISKLFIDLYPTDTKSFIRHT